MRPPLTRPELVAVGTSLGGLKALMTVLGGLPAQLRVPILVAQHRATDGDGQGLATLLQQHTPLKVQEAEDKMTIAAGSVYLAPADYHLLVEERGLLALSTDTPVNSARPSIDVLFETAAEAYGPSLVAVLLTGASADGAGGLSTVKARGGRAIVQDPATAESSTMPAAGIAAAEVDYVVPLEHVAQYIRSLVEGIRV
jgi:two-component system chemotaxis response regulator CheB